MQTRNEPVRAREPFMEMQWKIGNVQIDNPFVLAPMAGVLDSLLRQILTAVNPYDLCVT